MEASRRVVLPFMPMIYKLHTFGSVSNTINPKVIRNKGSWSWRKKVTTTISSVYGASFFGLASAFEQLFYEGDWFIQGWV